jgi:hypothetical protein
MRSADLDKLIEEATIDTYGEYEQRVGFYTLLDDNLSFPFPARVVGSPVTVLGLDMKDEEHILAQVRRSSREYAVDILDLEIDGKKVRGSEWIAAYRKWGGYV